MIPPELTIPLVTIIPAIIGAIYIAMVFTDLKRAPLIGAGIGAIAGVIGSALFMVPLDYCTFEPERKEIDVYFGIFLVALGTFAGLMAARVASRFFFSGQPLSLIAGQSSSGTFKGWFMPWLLLSPSLVILALFLYYPALDTFRLSTLLARLGQSRTVFVCVDNFTRLLRPSGFVLETLLYALIPLVLFFIARYIGRNYDSIAATFARYAFFLATIVTVFTQVLSRILDNTYYQVVMSTFFISSAIVIMSLSLALMIAYMAYQPVRGGAIYRTLLIWPYAISPPVAGIIFFIIFNQTGGIANHIIRALGGEGLLWLQDASIAPWTIILASVWKALGFSILFYIAGLQNVPRDLLEAAAIDGANVWQRFMRITVPMLSPITFFLIITNITYAFFDIFGTIDFLTRGGPARATSVMIYEVYQLGIINNDLGKAAAQSLVLFILVIGITYLQFRTTGRRVSYGA